MWKKYATLLRDDDCSCFCRRYCQDNRQNNNSTQVLSKISESSRNTDEDVFYGYHHKTPNIIEKSTQQAITPLFSTRASSTCYNSKTIHNDDYSDRKEAVTPFYSTKTPSFCHNFNNKDQFHDKGNVKDNRYPNSECRCVQPQKTMRYQQWSATTRGHHEVFYPHLWYYHPFYYGKSLK